MKQIDILCERKAAIQVVCLNKDIKREKRSKLYYNTCR